MPQDKYKQAVKARKYGSSAGSGGDITSIGPKMRRTKTGVPPRETHCAFRKTQPEPERQPEPEPERQPEPEPERQPEPKPERQPEPEPEIESLRREPTRDEANEPEKVHDAKMIEISSDESSDECQPIQDPGVAPDTSGRAPGGAPVTFGGAPDEASGGAPVSPGGAPSSPSGSICELPALRSPTPPSPVSTHRDDVVFLDSTPKTPTPTKDNVFTVDTSPEPDLPALDASPELDLPAFNSGGRLLDNDQPAPKTPNTRNSSPISIPDTEDKMPTAKRYRSRPRACTPRGQSPLKTPVVPEAQIRKALSASRGNRRREEAQILMPGTVLVVNLRPMDGYSPPDTPPELVTSSTADVTSSRIGLTTTCDSLAHKNANSPYEVFDHTVCQRVTGRKNPTIRGDGTNLTNTSFDDYSAPPPPSASSPDLDIDALSTRCPSQLDTFRTNLDFQHFDQPNSDNEGDGIEMDISSDSSVQLIGVEFDKSKKKKKASLKQKTLFAGESSKRKRVTKKRRRVENGPSASVDVENERYRFDLFKELEARSRIIARLKRIPKSNDKCGDEYIPLGTSSPKRRKRNDRFDSSSSSNEDDSFHCTPTCEKKLRKRKVFSPPPAFTSSDSDFKLSPVLSPQKKKYKSQTDPLVSSRVEFDDNLPAIARKKKPMGPKCRRVQVESVDTYQLKPCSVRLERIELSKMNFNAGTEKNRVRNDSDQSGRRTSTPTSTSTSRSGSRNSVHEIEVPKKVTKTKTSRSNRNSPKMRADYKIPKKSFAEAIAVPSTSGHAAPARAKTKVKRVTSLPAKSPRRRLEASFSRTSSSTTQIDNGAGASFAHSENLNQSGRQTPIPFETASDSVCFPNLNPGSPSENLGNYVPGSRKNSQEKEKLSEYARSEDARFSDSLEDLNNISLMNLSFEDEMGLIESFLNEVPKSNESPAVIQPSTSESVGKIGQANDEISQIVDHVPPKPISETESTDSFLSRRRWEKRRENVRSIHMEDPEAGGDCRKSVPLRQMKECEGKGSLNSSSLADPQRFWTAVVQSRSIRRKSTDSCETNVKSLKVRESNPSRQNTGPLRTDNREEDVAICKSLPETTVVGLPELQGNVFFEAVVDCNNNDEVDPEYEDNIAKEAEKDESNGPSLVEMEAARNDAETHSPSQHPNEKEKLSKDHDKKTLTNVLTELEMDEEEFDPDYEDESPSQDSIPPEHSKSDGEISDFDEVSLGDPICTSPKVDFEVFEADDDFRTSTPVAPLVENEEPEEEEDGNEFVPFSLQAILRAASEHTKAVPYAVDLDADIYLTPPKGPSSICDKATDSPELAEQLRDGKTALEVEKLPIAGNIPIAPTVLNTEKLSENERSSVEKEILSSSQRCAENWWETGTIVGAENVEEARVPPAVEAEVREVLPDGEFPFDVGVCASAEDVSPSPDNVTDCEAPKTVTNSQRTQGIEQSLESGEMTMEESAVGFVFPDAQLEAEMSTRSWAVGGMAPSKDDACRENNDVSKGVEPSGEECTSVSDVQTQGKSPHDATELVPKDEEPPGTPLKKGNVRTENVLESQCSDATSVPKEVYQPENMRRVATLSSIPEAERSPRDDSEGSPNSVTLDTKLVNLSFVHRAPTEVAVTGEDICRGEQSSSKSVDIAPLMEEMTETGKSHEVEDTPGTETSPHEVTPLAEVIVPKIETTVDTETLPLVCDQSECEGDSSKSAGHLLKLEISVDEKSSPTGQSLTEREVYHEKNSESTDFPKGEETSPQNNITLQEDPPISPGLMTKVENCAKAWTLPTNECGQESPSQHPLDLVFVPKSEVEEDHEVDMSPREILKPDASPREERYSSRIDGVVPKFETHSDSSFSEETLTASENDMSGYMETDIVPKMEIFSEIGRQLEYQSLRADDSNEYLTEPSVESEGENLMTTENCPIDDSSKEDEDETDGAVFDTPEETEVKTETGWPEEKKFGGAGSLEYEIPPEMVLVEGPNGKQLPENCSETNDLLDFDTPKAIDMKLSPEYISSILDDLLTAITDDSEHYSEAFTQEQRLSSPVDYSQKPDQDLEEEDTSYSAGVCESFIAPSTFTGYTLDSSPSSEVEKRYEHLQNLSLPSTESSVVTSDDEGEKDHIKTEEEQEHIQENVVICQGKDFFALEAMYDVEEQGNLKDDTSELEKASKEEELLRIACEKLIKDVDEILPKETEQSEGRQSSEDQVKVECSEEDASNQPDDASGPKYHFHEIEVKFEKDVSDREDMEKEKESLLRQDVEKTDTSSGATDKVIGIEQFKVKTENHGEDETDTNFIANTVEDQKVKDTNGIVRDSERDANLVSAVGSTAELKLTIDGDTGIEGATESREEDDHINEEIPHDQDELKRNDEGQKRNQKKYLAYFDLQENVKSRADERTKKNDIEENYIDIQSIDQQAAGMVQELKKNRPSGSPTNETVDEASGTHFAIENVPVEKSPIGVEESEPSVNEQNPTMDEAVEQLDVALIQLENYKESSVGANCSHTEEQRVTIERENEDVQHSDNCKEKSDLEYSDAGDEMGTDDEEVEDDNLRHDQDEEVVHVAEHIAPVNGLDSVREKDIATRDIADEENDEMPKNVSENEHQIEEHDFDVLELGDEESEQWELVEGVRLHRESETEQEEEDEGEEERMSVEDEMGERDRLLVERRDECGIEPVEGAEVEMDEQKNWELREVDEPYKEENQADVKEEEKDRLVDSGVNVEASLSEGEVREEDGDNEQECVEDLEETPDKDGSESEFEVEGLQLQPGSDESDFENFITPTKTRKTLQSERKLRHRIHADTATQEPTKKASPVSKSRISSTKTETSTGSSATVAAADVATDLKVATDLDVATDSASLVDDGSRKTMQLHQRLFQDGSSLILSQPRRKQLEQQFQEAMQLKDFNRAYADFRSLMRYNLVSNAVLRRFLTLYTWCTKEQSITVCEYIISFIKKNNIVDSGTYELLLINGLRAENTSVLEETFNLMSLNQCFGQRAEVLDELISYLVCHRPRLSVRVLQVLVSRCLPPVNTVRQCLTHVREDTCQEAVQAVRMLPVQALHEIGSMHLNYLLDLCVRHHPAGSCIIQDKLKLLAPLDPKLCRQIQTLISYNRLGEVAYKLLTLPQDDVMTSRAVLDHVTCWLTSPLTSSGTSLATVLSTVLREVQKAGLSIDQTSCPPRVTSRTLSVMTSRALVRAYAWKETVLGLGALSWLAKTDIFKVYEKPCDDLYLLMMSLDLCFRCDNFTHLQPLLAGWPLPKMADKLRPLVGDDVMVKKVWHLLKALLAKMAAKCRPAECVGTIEELRRWGVDPEGRQVIELLTRTVRDDDVITCGKLRKIAREVNVDIGTNMNRWLLVKLCGLMEDDRSLQSATSLYHELCTSTSGPYPLQNPTSTPRQLVLLSWLTSAELELIIMVYLQYLFSLDGVENFEAEDFQIICKIKEVKGMAKFDVLVVENSVRKARERCTDILKKLSIGFWVEDNDIVLDGLSLKCRYDVMNDVRPVPEVDMETFPIMEVTMEDVMPTSPFATQPLATVTGMAPKLSAGTRSQTPPIVPGMTSQVADMTSPAKPSSRDPRLWQLAPVAPVIAPQPQYPLPNQPTTIDLQTLHNFTMQGIAQFATVFLQQLTKPLSQPNVVQNTAESPVQHQPSTPEYGQKRPITPIPVNTSTPTVSPLQSKSPSISPVFSSGSPVSSPESPPVLPPDDQWVPIVTPPPPTVGPSSRPHANRGAFSSRAPLGAPMAGRLIPKATKFRKPDGSGLLKHNCLGGVRRLGSSTFLDSKLS